VSERCQRAPQGNGGRLRQPQEYALAPQLNREQGTPTEQKVRLIRLEAQALTHAIECRFVRTGRINVSQVQAGRAGNARLCATSA